MNIARLPTGLKLSLLELLALTLFAGLGAAALRTGGALAAIVLQGALCFAAGSAVLAVFARGDWRAFAVGALVGVAVYFAPVWYSGEGEFDPYTTRLPLTQPAFPLWNALENEAWVHEPTGERFNVWTTNVSATQDATFSGNFQPPFYSLPDGRIVTSWERVPRSVFMTTYHALLALASGYVFGKFAGSVYRRQDRRRDPSSRLAAEGTTESRTSTS